MGKRIAPTNLKPHDAVAGSKKYFTKPWRICFRRSSGNAAFSFRHSEIMSIFNHRHRRKRRIAGEAATWLARHDAGTIDEKRFLAWRDASPEHAIAFTRALAVWNEAGARAGVSVESRFTRRRAAAAIGGMALVGLLGAGGFTTRAYAWNSASSKVGECKRVVLPDGSRAMLNTDSELQWRFSSTERSLWIVRGEVGLELVGGSPAQIHGLDRIASLSQGRFNVRLEGAAMDVTVLAGKAAAMRAPKAEALIAAAAAVAAPSEGLLLSAAAPSVREASPQRLAATVAWQQGEILFDNEPLQTAVREYNRYLTGKIVIADPDLTGIPVGGRFTSTDPADFLSALELGLGVRATASNGGFVLTR